MSDRQSKEQQDNLTRTIQDVAGRLYDERTKTAKTQIDDVASGLQSEINTLTGDLEDLTSKAAVATDLDLLRNDLRDLSKKTDGLSNRVSELNGRVLTQNEILNNIYSRIASASPPQLRNALPALEYVMEVGLQEGVQFGEYETVSLQARLQLIDRSAPSYWPVVSKVLTYRSNNLTGVKAPTDAPPVTMQHWSYSSIQSSAVVLDGKYFEHVIFQDSLIVYRGGPTVVRRCTFVNCVFVIAIETVPSEEGLRFARDLLESNLVRVDTG